MIVGKSETLRRALAQVERFAVGKLPILIVGPTGTGKELLARRAHQLSGRRGQLVSVNCGALPREMADSLLFGHRRGAFTGALESHVGHVERSNRGTLFLDELACLAPEVQAKLLRVLDDGVVLPLGGREERLVDLRVVGAAQEDILDGAAGGEFREDLLARLAGVVIRLTRLVDRQEDILPLAEYFAGLSGRTLEAGAANVLLHYDWPRNVRELRMVIERAGGLVENGTLSASALAEAIELGAPVQAKGRRVIVSDEGAQLRELCERCRGDVKEIARVLGVRRSTVYSRLRAHGIAITGFRPSKLSYGRWMDDLDGKEVPAS
jgi:DNA-binding NtrC family response regulator